MHTYPPTYIHTYTHTHRCTGENIDTQHRQRHNDLKTERQNNRKHTKTQMQTQTQTQTQTLTQTQTQTQMRTQTQTQTHTDTHKCRQRHNGQVFVTKPFYFVRRGGHRGNLFCFLLPKFLFTTTNLPKSVAHSVNDSSKSSTDMSHTLRQRDSSNQTHSCLEKMTLIMFIIFLPLVQIILALQHVFMCVIHPHHLPTSLFVIRLGSCLLLCRFYHGMVCDFSWICCHKVSQCPPQTPNIFLGARKDTQVSSEVCTQYSL